MASGKQNYYTNPAFCQQSEFYNAQQRCTSPRGRALSPERRQPPVGAHKPLSNEGYHASPRVAEIPPKVGPKPKLVQRRNSVQVKSYNDNEQNYEEMLVDDSHPHQSTRKTEDHDNQKYIDASNGNVKQTTKYNYTNGNDQDNEEYVQERRIITGTNKGRYEVIPGDDDEPENTRTTKHRYEYIPMQEQANGYPSSPRKQLQKPTMQCEEIEVVQGRVHRYSVIPADEDLDKPSNKGRYALVPVSEIKPNSRYAVIPAEEINRNIGRYDYIPQPEPDNRYYHETNHNVPRRNVQQDYYVTSTPIKTVISPQTPRKGNPIATQKLHELLTTPKKVQRSQSLQHTPHKMLSPQSQRRPLSPQPVDPFCTPNKTPPKVIRHQTPKAQQKLNYTLSTRQENIMENKRHTAVIAPICSSPVQSVYSETTFSNKTESWMNLSIKKPAQGTLAVAAVMMILCGGLTSTLCFYMVSVVGRMYYLDFGIVSGFACLLLGLLAFRSRNCHWLPNRNYISGKL